MRATLLVLLFALLALHVTSFSVSRRAESELVSDSDIDVDVDSETEHEVAVEDGDKCARQGGTCMAMTACNGKSLSGFCPGAANIRCCIAKKVAPAPTPKPTPAPTPAPSNGAAPKCSAKGGSCMDVAACAGQKGHSMKGLCPGASNVQCCITNWKDGLDKAAEKGPSSFALILDGSLQRLRVYDAAKTKCIKEYVVSTGKHGFGSIPESGATPYGNFRVRVKTNKAAKLGEIILNGRAQGYSAKDPDRSAYMTTRILALEGLDKSNRNTAARGIAIHGTNRESRLGRPDSHGCIRLSNKDVVEVFDMIPVGTPLTIVAKDAFKGLPEPATPAKVNLCGKDCK